jgi:hypothetical protein
MSVEKGYYTNGDYMGYVPYFDSYMKFESEMAYHEYMETFESEEDSEEE